MLWVERVREIGRESESERVGLKEGRGLMSRLKGGT